LRGAQAAWGLVPGRREGWGGLIEMRAKFNPPLCLRFAA
jgi:hypothetical protein